MLNGHSAVLELIHRRFFSNLNKIIKNTTLPGGQSSYLLPQNDNTAPFEGYFSYKQLDVLKLDLHSV